MNRAAANELTLIRDVRLIDPHGGIDERCDVWIDDTGVRRIAPGSQSPTRVIDGQGLWALPGLLDLQVHFRQPGFEYKETIESGSAAALAGGITSVVVMPNTKPSLDTPERVIFESEESRRVDGIDILVAAAVTHDLDGEHLTDHGALKRAGAVAVTDDGLPVMNDDVMAASLRACKEHDLLFMQHAEDLRVSKHRPMTEGTTSRSIGIEGQPADAEGIMVERDLALVESIGARYHVLHTSTKRSLDAIRAAKAKGLRVSCEASPHHLFLTYEACAGKDPNTKMNPPLRSPEDRAALREALRDGTVDAVATDHAPHSAEEKARGFLDAPFGVTGLETAFAAVMTLRKEGLIDDTRAVELMTSRAARVIGLEGKVGTLSGPDAPAHLCLVDPELSWTVGVEDMRGKSRNSAFLDHTFHGRVVATFLRGRLRYELDGALRRQSESPT